MRTDPKIVKRRALYTGHDGWQAKKFLGLRWSKNTKITLETVNFREISIQYI